MGYGFAVEIWGDYALFSRPELNVERYSYEVITPSAARGILEAILWKPAIHYVIDKIHVVNPIKVTNLRRNEVDSKISARNVSSVMNGKSGALYLNTSKHIQQRASLLLKDVRYVIEAHFEMTELAGDRDTPEKFYNMMLRRLRKGQCFVHPYLGAREFPAHFRLWEDEEIPSYYKGEHRDFGLMLWDLDYQDKENIQSCYFHAMMEDGTIDLRNCEVLR